MKKNEQASDPSLVAKPLDTVAEFQRRRKVAAKRAGPFLAATVLCVVGLIVLFNVNLFSPERRVMLFVLLGFGAFVSWGLHLYFETKYARCPNCEKLPMNATGALDFNPANCPKCGARLREYSSMF